MTQPTPHTSTEAGGPAFAPHADVRIIIEGVYKLEAAMNAAGLYAPALSEARDMLARLSWKVHQAEGGAA